MSSLTLLRSSVSRGDNRGMRGWPGCGSWFRWATRLWGLTTREVPRDSKRITTPFGAQSTATEVVAGIDLGGRRVIVTGGASGIGAETARALAAADAEATLAVRNLAAGEHIAEEITVATGNKHVLVAALDLADQMSVAAFVADWEGRCTSWSTMPASWPRR
jgi:hypothetical protein